MTFISLIVVAAKSHNPTQAYSTYCVACQWCSAPVPIRICTHRPVSPVSQWLASSSHLSNQSCAADPCRHQWPHPSPWA